MSTTTSDATGYGNLDFSSSSHSLICIAYEFCNNNDYNPVLKCDFPCVYVAFFWVHLISTHNTNNLVNRMRINIESIFVWHRIKSTTYNVDGSF